MFPGSTNPLKRPLFKARDKKWALVDGLARRQMRLAAYSCSLSALLSQAQELGVDPEDREAIVALVGRIGEIQWDQASRAAVLATAERRVEALGALGFSDRDAASAVGSVPFLGPSLFGGKLA